MLPSANCGQYGYFVNGIEVDFVKCTFLIINLNSEKSDSILTPYHFYSDSSDTNALARPTPIRVAASATDNRSTALVTPIARRQAATENNETT